MSSHKIYRTATSCFAIVVNVRLHLYSFCFVFRRRFEIVPHADANVHVQMQMIFVYKRPGNTRLSLSQNCFLSSFSFKMLRFTHIHRYRDVFTPELVFILFRFGTKVLCFCPKRNCLQSSLVNHGSYVLKITCNRQNPQNSQL